MHILIEEEGPSMIKYLVASIISFVAVICGLLMHTELFYLFTVSSPTDNPTINWIIDAGHGGEDGGAISITGVPESGINLQIAKKIDYLFGFLGEPTLMLRNEDVSLYDDSATTIREKKVSDLHYRTEITNHNQNATLLSIHQNTFSQPEYSGTQVFYAPTDGSQTLAEQLQCDIQTYLQPNNQRYAKLIYETVYLMNHIDNRAVLLECGFISNPQEEKILQETDYQIKFAMVVTSSCLKQ